MIPERAGGSMLVTNFGYRTRARRGLRALALTGALGLLLVGCASATVEVPVPSESPTPSSQAPTPTPTPTPAAPAPEVSTILMSGSGLASETAAQQPVSTVEFSDGTEAAVEFLTAALSVAPEQFTESEIDACGTVTARYSWGGRALILDVWEPAGFVITFGEAGFDGVALQSSGRFAVGDNAQAFFDALSAEQASDEYDNASGPFVYDQVAEASPWGEENAYGGVALLQPGGVVSRIVSPDTTRAFYC